MQISKPNRVVRSYTQQLVAAPSEVFPLLYPVREADWIDGWDPILVISSSGFAEADCVFLTGAKPHEAIWYVTRYEPVTGYVEMIKITPSVTACRLSIQLRATEGGSESVVTYCHTSLGPEGDSFIESFTDYLQFMRDRESRMNHYITHGLALKSPHG